MSASPEGRRISDMSGPTQPWDHADDPRDSTAAPPGADTATTGHTPAAELPSVPPSGQRSPEPPSAAPTAVGAARPATAAQGPNGAARVPEEPAARTPRAWSLADLRARLARLPDGHPSSPYDDDGTAKPPPPRLRQLELGLPAPERERANGHPGSAGPEHAAGPPIDVLAEFRNGHEPARSTEPHADDEPFGWTDVPDAPARAAEAGAEPAQPVSHAGTAPANGSGGAADDSGSHLRTAPPATAPPATGSPATAPPATGSPAPATRAGNGGEHRQARRELQDPYALAPVRSKSQPDDAAAQLPSAQHEELVKRMLAVCRAAEGRNMFGSYGERGITPAIRRIAGQLPHGGLAPDSEADSLKDAGRFSAKLARLIARFPGTPAEDLAASISDGVRYAFTFEPALYTESTQLVHRKLKAQGFELEARRNRWTSPEYKGIWTRWRDPAHDQAFEVQFHTAASWAVVRQTHDAYVKITDPGTAPSERARLRALQVAAAADATPPPECMEISDFRQEAR
jgi:hypothetical protein